MTPGLALLTVYVILSGALGGAAALENWPRSRLRAVWIGLLVAVIWPLLAIA